MRIGYRPEIDGLRAFAVLSVLIFHYFPEVLPGGFVGVDIFFVISGYLISKNIFCDLGAGKFNFLDFYSRRIRRIFPALILIFLFVLILGWLLFTPLSYFRLSKHVLAGAGFVSNLLLWSESGYFDVASSSKPLLHLWSLGIEEQFYLLWPLAIWLMWNRKFSLFWLIIVIFFVSFLLNLYLVSYSSKSAFYFLAPRAWELLAGALLACSEINSAPNKAELKQKFLLNFGSFFGALCLIFGVFFITNKSQFPGWVALFPIIGSILILRAGNLSWINRVILSNRPMLWIGLISYSLYLWHWPLLILAGILDLGTHLLEIRFILIFLSFFLAYLTYKYIEKPFQNIAQSAFKTWTLIIAMFCVIGISLIIFWNQGFPDRFLSLKGLASSESSASKIIFNESFGQNFRAQKCFLVKGQGPNDFEAQCRSKDRNNEVFVWGDSHAASLYPGFNYGEKNGFVSQFTASTCPPILDWETTMNVSCRAINDHVISIIKKSPPKIVVLYAAWDWDSYLLEEKISNIQNTIEDIYAAGVKRVIILGPPPTWKKNVPDIIFDHIREFGNVPSQYTNFALANLSRAYLMERNLKIVSKVADAHYYSLLDVLCKTGRCMIYVNEASNPISMDSGHFSNIGASIVINSIRSEMYKNLE
jgi:peptidoglycan/LPS O-acetylase OafA/YrhL